MLSHMFAIRRQNFVIAKSTVGDGFQRLSRCRHKANHPDVETTDLEALFRMPSIITLRSSESRIVRLISCSVEARQNRPLDHLREVDGAQNCLGVELTHSGSESEDKTLWLRIRRPFVLQRG